MNSTMVMVLVACFVLGVAALAIVAMRSAAAQARRRQQLRAQLHGLAEAQFHKHMLRSIRVPVPAGPGFRLSQETERTHQMRAQGRLVELQVGVADFDRQIYIEADDPGLAQWLAADGPARELILSLTRSGRTIQRRRRHLVLDNPDPQGGALRTLAVQLRDLADRLPVLTGNAPAAQAQRWRLRLVWTVLGCILAATGGCGLQQMLESDAPFPQHPSLWPLLLMGGLVGVVCGGLLRWLALRWLRGGSHGPRMAGQLVVLGWVPLTALGMLGAPLINRHAATAPEQQEVSKILGLYSTRGKSTRFYLLLPALAGGRIEASEYGSSRWLNANLKERQQVLVYWREGALGVDFLTRDPEPVQPSTASAR